MKKVSPSSIKVGQIYLQYIRGTPIKLLKKRIPSLNERYGIKTRGTIWGIVLCNYGTKCLKEGEFGYIRNNDGEFYLLNESEALLELI